MADIADHLWAHRTALARPLRRPPAGGAARRPVRGEHPRTRAATGRSPSTGPTSGGARSGSDLGYLSLATREDVEPLVEAYVAALPAGLAAVDEVLTGARVMAVYTALTRLDWALARVADGEGALAGKFRHPSVAPYIRAMQRQVDQIEALLA